MSAILETKTILTIIVNDFTMKTEYSGGVNPNITYDVLFIIIDLATDPIEDVSIDINGEVLLTDVNGQATFTLEREDYIADITKEGYVDDQDSFTVVDQNLNRNIQLDAVSSFDGSFDDSFGSQNSVIYDDWFLPSQDELEQMYLNLKVFGVGGFSTDTYWSSSEGSQHNGIVLNMTNGGIFQNTKQTLNSVRACRSFIASIGTYSLRDVGPAGGLIFHIDGTTYYESSLLDQSIDNVWSNIDNVLIGVTSTDIGTGAQNTLDIIGQVGHTDSAAKLCDDYFVFN